MKFEVTDRVAIFQTDAILGLSDDQARHRAHQLEALGKGRYRVIGPNVKFRFRETVDIIDGPAAPTAMKAEAAKLGIRFGLGIGAGTLAARIAVANADKDATHKAEAAAQTKAKTDNKAARAKAAKARR